MSSRREELQACLEKVDGLAFDRILDGPAVYFEPPASVCMVYPCIVYSRSGASIIDADDHTYHLRTRYSLTVIDSDPDSLIPDKLPWLLPMVSPDRVFTSNNLNHYTFTLYF